jgi:WD40 repeat protein
VKVVSGLLVEWETHSHTVSFDHLPLALACWENTTAVGLESGTIIILDATTGTHMSVLSGHTDWVRSLAFSSDGELLVSGSNDRTIKLWNIQTGNPFKTFSGHSRSILSVSISADSTMIASGSQDHTIRLWDVQIGGYTVVPHKGPVTCVNFSPVDPQHFISASQDGTIQQWGVDGNQVGPPHSGTHVAFSLDGTHFISHQGKVAKVQNSASGVVVAELVANDYFWCCCFSRQGRFVAGAAGHNVYVWDITGPNPRHIETHIGHTSFTTSLVFSSYLISASDDKTIKFWQTSTLSPADPVTADTNPTPLVSSPIKSINLQAKDGIAISSDLAGVVTIWDISTGQSKASFKTSATGKRDVQQTNGRLIMVWHDWRIGVPGKAHVWDVEKDELLWTLSQSWSRVLDLRISGDGSKVFLLYQQSIQAWSISTGEAVGEVKFEESRPWGLIVNGSKVWLSCLNPMARGFSDSNIMGWDFGSLGSSSILSHNTSPDKPRLDFMNGTTYNCAGSSWIEDTITGRLVFPLPERFTTISTVSQWDGRYLVVGHPSGDVSILDFCHVRHRVAQGFEHGSSHLLIT